MTEQSHPLVGIKTTIYGDPEHKKEPEGRALVVAVLGSAHVSKTMDVYTCEVHFIGDRRGYNVKRNILMRRVDAK